MTSPGWSLAFQIPTEDQHPLLFTDFLHLGHETLERLLGWAAEKEQFVVDESKREDAARAMRQINQAWVDGQVQDLAPMLHPEIVMVLPGFIGSMQGREDFLAGFRDFCQNATIQEFHERDHRVDVAGDTAVVTFRYDMIYERSGKRYRSTGRDLWVLQKQGRAWIAVWRTMLDMEESAT